MKTQLSDNDFYERKIHRLEADIATLHEQLNIARGRLRSAQDYQIKYQLLLRQSNHENLRLKKLEQIERQKFNKLLVQELQKAQKIWTTRMQEFEQSVIDQQADEKDQLKKQVLSLKRKIQEMTAKTDQMDALLFKNKKIAKDLQGLQQLLQQNKIKNQKNKQDELRACKQSLTKKYQQKSLKDKEFYQQKILIMEKQIERLSSQLVSQAIKTDRIEKKEGDEGRSIVQSVVPAQIEKLNQIICQKNNEIEEIQKNKLIFEESILSQKKQLNIFIKELEQKIFKIEKAQQIQLFNLKSRMEKAHDEEKEQLQRKNEIVVMEKLKQSSNKIKQLNQQLEELKEYCEKLQKDVQKYSHDKQKLAQKVVQLKSRLKDFEHDRQIGQTQLLISSFKNTQGKEDQTANYEHGVNFLQKQLRKAAIKIDKKNDEVKQLITDITRIRNECEQQVNELRDKYYNDMDDAQNKIKKLEDNVRQLNQQIRKREKDKRDIEINFTKTISQLRVELRGLRNLNSDLQRDNNRILESKKVIEKSFRQERQRSVTSKSEIANTKKQKWLELERQKNDIQIIYKEKEQQIKTQTNMIIEQLRVENNNLKKENALLKNQLTERTTKENVEDNKQNTFSEYHKKLATINLQIALTENLYNTLIEAKSRKKIPAAERVISDIDQRPDEESLHSSAKFIGSQQIFDDLIPHGDDSEIVEGLKKQLEKGSQNKEKETGNLGGHTPSFNMYQSFNPKFPSN